jgi:hypothetical protein
MPCAASMSRNFSMGSVEWPMVKITQLAAGCSPDFLA